MKNFFYGFLLIGNLIKNVISNFRFIFIFIYIRFFCKKETNYGYSLTVPKNSRVIIYGYGLFGKNALDDLFVNTKIVAIYDKKLNNLPNSLNLESYDFVILSVMDTKARISIMSYFNDLHIPFNRIIYMYNLL